MTRATLTVESPTGRGHAWIYVAGIGLVLHRWDGRRGRWVVGWR